MNQEISVRHWQENFQSGTYSDNSFMTQVSAGWYDWFCSDDELPDRLKEIAQVVMGITDPFILDNYYVWFKNNCPVVGPLYDDVRFEPLADGRNGKYFVVSLDSPHENSTWALFTERHGLDEAEFGCDNVREMIQYINRMGPELEAADHTPQKSGPNMA